MLKAVAKLRQDFFRYVDRVLRHEINPNPLGADQANNLLDLVEQLFRRLVEEKVRFVEEEDELRLRRVADLGQFLEQF